MGKNLGKLREVLIPIRSRKGVDLRVSVKLNIPHSRTISEIRKRKKVEEYPPEDKLFFMELADYEFHSKLIKGGIQNE